MRNDSAALSFGEKLGYGLGDTASNFFFQVFNLFLLYYYTDVYGLAPAAVGTMFLVTKIVDAISDPLMGIVADRTESRWGKFRPYLLFFAVPYGVCGYAMFAGPDLSDTGRLIYAYATYTLMMLAYTAINVPYSALMGVISPSSLERTRVSAFRFACAFGAGWLIATFVTPLKTVLGDGDEAQGFRLTMALFAVISIGLFWVTFVTTRERVRPPPQSTDVRADFAALLSNGPWIALFFSGVFALMNVAVRSGGTLYFFKYYVGDDGTPLIWILDRTAVFLSLSTAGMLLGIALTQTLLRRFDKRTLMIALTIANGLSMACFFVIPPDEYLLMVCVSVLGAVLAGPTPVLVWAMYADCADYGEWRSGRRTTALVFSASQFAQKLGLAVGAGLSGWILSLFGFVANAAQSEGAMFGIRLMFSVFPAVLAFASAAAIFFYRLDGSTVRRMEQELAERRGDVDGAGSTPAIA
jgi:GPH family glycoside/pentoside/hexuronide:cation symporter